MLNNKIFFWGFLDFFWCVMKLIVGLFVWLGVFCGGKWINEVFNWLFDLIKDWKYFGIINNLLICYFKKKIFEFNF